MISRCVVATTERALREIGSVPNCAVVIGVGGRECDVCGAQQKVSSRRLVRIDEFESCSSRRGHPPAVNTIIHVLVAPTPMMDHALGSAKC